MNLPSTNDSGDSKGRDDHGRFTIGNPGGPGNPFANKVGAWRSALTEAISTDDVRIVVRRLVKAAKNGEKWAVKELLDRTVGKVDKLSKQVTRTETIDEFTVELRRPGTSQSS